MLTTRQLVLPFVHRPGFEAMDFLRDASNAEALAWLERTPDWPDRRLALWGDAGCGKSHLLHVWAREHRALLCAGPDLRGPPPVLPDGGVAIDDADMAADETALLHLLNAARDAGCPTLLAARGPPARWTVALPDLASRLRAVTAVRIAPPEAALLDALLTRLLSDRQLAMAANVRDWLLSHLPRTPAALRDAIARLDHAGLAAGRPITRAMAQAVLTIDAPDENFDTEAHSSCPAARLL